MTDEETTANPLPTYDPGPLQTYEITWTSGHVETVQGHQVSWPANASMFSTPGQVRPSRVVIHGYFGSHFRLVLSALEDDIRTIRNITADESLPRDGGDR